MPFAKLRICPSRSPREATFSQTSRTNCVGIAIMYLSEKFSAASRSVVQFTLRGSSVSRKQKLLRRVSVIAFAWLSSIVHMSASLPSDARCTAIAVPKLPAPRIVIFISLPPFTFTRRAPARPLDFFIIAQRGGRGACRSANLCALLCTAKLILYTQWVALLN